MYVNVLNPSILYMQATGIGGRGYFWYTLPGQKFFENTPWRFWDNPPFGFLNEKKVKISLNLTRFRLYTQLTDSHNVLDSSLEAIAHYSRVETKTLQQAMRR